MSLVCVVQCDRCQQTVLAPNTARLCSRKNALAFRAGLKARGWQVGPSSRVNEPDRCPECVEKYGPVVPGPAAPEILGDTPAEVQRAIDLEMSLEESRHESPY